MTHPGNRPSKNGDFFTQSKMKSKKQKHMKEKIGCTFLNVKTMTQHKDKIFNTQIFTQNFIFFKIKAV